MNPVGCAGVAVLLGVTVLNSEAVPTPLLFTALIRIRTCTSLAMRITVVPIDRGCQVTSISLSPWNLIINWYVVMEGSLGSSHERYIRSSPGFAVNPVGFAGGGMGVLVGVLVGVGVAVGV